MYKYIWFPLKVNNKKSHKIFLLPSSKFPNPPSLTSPISFKQRGYLQFIVNKRLLSNCQAKRIYESVNWFMRNKSEFLLLSFCCFLFHILSLKSSVIATCFNEQKLIFKSERNNLTLFYRWKRKRMFRLPAGTWNI